jgi:hypothetical protein
MATSVLKSISGSANGDYADSVTAVYEVQTDTIITNFYSALVAAQTASGSPVPPRRTLYGGGPLIYAYDINGQHSEVKRNLWTWTVTYSQPPQDEGTGTPTENPLERPVIYNVEYMDREYVIQKAKNVEELPRGDGNGGNRAAGTLAPIGSAAGERPDEPIVDTERLEVLVVQRYYPTLAAITAINRTYKRSTNSGALLGYGPRELRYLLTESLGVTNINGLDVWPGRTTVLAEDTTDLILDNQGTQYWDPVAAKIRKTEDLKPPLNLVNLTLGGELGGTKEDTITYRHLTEKDYGPLLA